ncbi:P-loop NTPase [Saccharolobus islandicus]|uniref:Ras-like GTPase superfamily n=1 Tax=Saccharolobus islandicus (strain REY15A) TaxID=930945 RepID=F0NG85_SACI5|nr:ParA family protein [Sulfolobus islandicus]ADX84231.1 Ras-like GTPase superfamily [Sulfolobus islandicus REY15A]
MTTNIVRVLSIKGGVGKSSIAYALTRTISASGYKVLFLDMDNLHTISRVLGVKDCELTYIRDFFVFACDDFSKISFTNYEYVIIDTYSGISTETLSVIKGDLIYNIFISDFSSIDNSLSYIKEWNGKRSINFLVVNMVIVEDNEYDILLRKFFDSLALKSNVKINKVFLFFFDENYYGSYKVDLNHIELLASYVLGGIGESDP